MADSKKARRALRAPRRRRIDGAQLQLSARVTRPRGVIITKDILYAAFEKWLDGASTRGIEFRLTLWDGREIDSPLDDSPRARSLATVLRRLLRARRIPLNKVG